MIVTSSIRFNKSDHFDLDKIQTKVIFDRSWGGGKISKVPPRIPILPVWKSSRILPAVERVGCASHCSNIYDFRLYLCLQTSGRSSWRSITARCAIPDTRSGFRLPWTGVVFLVPGVRAPSALPAAWVGIIGWSASTCHASSVRTATCVASIRRLYTGTSGWSTTTWSWNL